MARRSPRTSGPPVAMKRVEDEIEQELVEVVAAQVVVAVAGQHLGHVRRSTCTRETSKVPPPRS